MDINALIQQLEKANTRGWPKWRVDEFQRLLKEAKDESKPRATREEIAHCADLWFRSCEDFLSQQSVV